MAIPRIGLNEGSLLRRTLLHVGTFVLGSMAFVGFVSFVLVSIANRLASPSHTGTGTDDATERADGDVEGAASKPGKPGLKALRKKPPMQTVEHPSKDD